METKFKSTPHPLAWVAGIAVVLFCAVGIAAIMGWIPSSSGQVSEGKALTDQSKAAIAANSQPEVTAHKVLLGAAGSQSVQTTCSKCGVIDSSREIDTHGEGSGLGAVGGAVVGGLLGNQVGNGHGRDLAIVVGAVGGGMAGNQIEKNAKSSKSYETTVRMYDGSSRVFHEAVMPNWRSGDQVKIVDGSIRAN